MGKFNTIREKIKNESRSLTFEEVVYYNEKYVSNYLNTIPYEILTSIGDRVYRIYG